MSKEYYRKRIIDLRASIAKEREAKKRDNENYAASVKRASSTDMKAYYRRQKVDASERHKRNIERLQREVERARESLKREKN